MKKLAGIKVLIWDSDGTLYHATEHSREIIRNAQFHVIQDHTGWPRDKSESEFYKVFRHQTPSGTVATSLLCNISTTKAARESETYIDRSEFLKRDEKLVSMFKALARFRHYMLVNGLRETTRKTLTILGVPVKTFEEIVTSEVVGDNKPSSKGFQYILGKTKLPPEAHLMIGDRDDVDISPAIALGIRTCLAWGKSMIADVSVPTVYDVKELLLPIHSL